MQAARGDIQAVRSKLYRQIKTVVAGVMKQFELAKAAEKELEQVAAGSKRQLQKISGKSFQLESLKREVEVNRNLYDIFLNRLKETGAALSGVKAAHARIIDAAEPALIPYKPRKQRIVMISMMMTLIVASMLALLLDYLDNTFKGSRDVEERLGLSVLGALRKVGKGTEDRSDMLRQFIDNPNGEFAEAVRSIRTGVVLSGLDSPHKVLVVTSSVPGEGKTTTAVNLAVALGQMEKVLLIDADMRRPVIHGNIGLKAGVKGLSDLVAGAAELKDCIRELSGVDKVHLLPSGTIPPNPLELIFSKRFTEVLAHLDSYYDRIVIDSAPILAVSDAKILAQHANAVLYVIKVDDVPVSAVCDGVKQLRQVSAPLVGVVLNHMSVGRGNGYYGEYGHDYYGFEHVSTRS